MDVIPESSDGTIQVTRERLRRLEYRDWSLWITAILVMLALAFGVYSFSGIADSSNTPWWWFRADLESATRGLLALILIFGVFASHKQVQINRLRRELAGQMNLAAAMQTRAELFHKLAILDPLTGLYNRRFAMQHLPVELSRCERHGYKLTALMFDLNGLKLINDRHSHLAGDLALREFATALRRAIRSSDVAMRLGGDEFVVLLPDCENDAVPRVLARMHDLQVNFRGEKIPLTFAAGWAEHLKGENAEAVLARADQRLYEDKRTGRAGSQARAIHDQLRQAEKMEVMGRLTSGVAHDFNNLLTVIKGYAQLAADSLPASDALQPQLEQICRAAERAAALTGQLLAFSRKQSVQPRLLDLNTIITAMEMMLHRLVGEPIEISLQLAEGLSEVFADVGQIEQVVMNLAANARDAMPKGGKLTIATANICIGPEFVAAHPGARPGEHACITITDTGVGMDEETKSHIFEPFFTTKECGKGTGLGLSTVYGIVKQNGGYIRVQSQPQQGTSVSVYLRRSAGLQAAVARQAHPPEHRALRASGQPTLLVVESFDSLRKFMCEFLQAAGYNTLEAINGEQAIHMAAEYPDVIDVMICDVILPGMSGLELSECLAAERRNMQILYIAGYADDAAIYREWLQGAAHFLSAPFSPEDFAGKIKELLAAQKSGAAAVAADD